MKKIFLLIAVTICCFNMGCSKSQPAVTYSRNDTTLFFKGADVSWVTEMEAAGISFYDSTGTKADLFSI